MSKRLKSVFTNDMEVIVTEVWKDIIGYEGTYQVSNLGNVRRLTFVNNVVSKEKMHCMHPTDNGNGYLIVGLKTNGKRKNKYVHRLVADAFCEKKKGAKIVNHIDFDKYNNRAENLEWCTQRENVRASRHRMRGEKTVCKPTNTGEKYIIKKGKRFYVRSIKGYSGKGFYNIDDAIKYRDYIKELVYETS